MEIPFPLLLGEEIARAPESLGSAGLGCAGATNVERRGGNVALKLIWRRRSYTVLTDRRSSLRRALSYVFSMTKSIWLILA